MKLLLQILGAVVLVGELYTFPLRHASCHIYCAW